MIVKFTERENIEIAELEAKYDRLFIEGQALIDSLRPDPWPDTDSYFEGLNGKDNPEEWEAAIEQHNQTLTAYDAAGSPEWKAARDRYFGLFDEQAAERAALYQKCERRQFSELGGDPDRILADAKYQIDENIKGIYSLYTTGTIGGHKAYTGLLSANGLLNAESTRESIYRGLRLHLEALRSDKARHEQITEYISGAIRGSEYVDRETIGTAKAPPAQPKMDPIKIDMQLHSEARSAADRAAPTLPGYDRVPYSSMVYYTLGQMADLSKPFFPASKGTKVSRRRDAYGNQITLFDSKEAVVSLIHKGLDKVSETAQQLFIYGFIVGERQGWRGNTAHLTINEFMEYLGEDKNKNSWDYCVKKIDAALFELASHVMTITYKDKPGQSKKRDIMANTPIVQKTARERFTGQIELLYDEGILSAARTYFAILPEWSGRVKNFNGQRLSWLIYYRMNTAKSGNININNRDILEWLGLPTKKEDVKGRRYSREMIDPVMKAFESIEEAAGKLLKIRPSDDGRIDTFLPGYTQFEADKDAALHYKSIREKIENRQTKEQRAADRGKLKAIEKNSETQGIDPLKESE